MDVVRGEPASPFQQVAGVADLASVVVNIGPRGADHVNADLSLTLIRPPNGLEIGITASDRHSRGGLAIGTATVYDRAGSISSVQISAIANTCRM